MRNMSRIFGSLLMAVALLGYAACSDDSGGTDTTTPQDVIQDQTPPTDNGVPEDTTEPRDTTTDNVTPPTDNGGTDTVTPPTDEGGTDTVPPPTDEGCVPNCEGRVCGNNGCGGECEPGCGENEVCNLQGQCDATCVWEDDKPTSWGPGAVVSSLATPGDAAVVKATCFDYTGEGDGDNGLKGLAGQVNGPLSDAVNGGDIAIIFELAGVTDFVNTPSFQLNGLLGESTVNPPALTGDFYVQEDSYVKETCLPMIYFKGASITDGVLAAGPSEFRLSIPVMEGLVIDATLIQAQLKGTIANGDTTDGFEITGGVLSGVLTKEELENALNALQATCDAAPAPKPDYCGYLSVARSAMALLFDLHQNGDGTFSPKSKELPGDAASVCLTFGASKAKVIGFPPAN